MASRIRTIDFLPEIFQTPSNQQFLSATLDQLVQPPNYRKIQGYIGSKFGYGVNASDSYVGEPTKTRKDYQLENNVDYDLIVKKYSDIMKLLPSVMFEEWYEYIQKNKKILKMIK